MYVHRSLENVILCYKEIIQFVTLGQEQEEIKLVDVGEEEEPKEVSRHDLVIINYTTGPHMPKYSTVQPELVHNFKYR